MKVSKLFTLDIEVVEALKMSENASHLVNQLLLDHLSIQSKDKDIERLNKKKQLASKIKEINKEIRVFDQLKALGVDQKALNWLNNGNYPNVHSLTWREYCRGRGINVNFSAMIEIIKKNEWVLNKR